MHNITPTTGGEGIAGKEPIEAAPALGSPRYGRGESAPADFRRRAVGLVSYHTALTQEARTESGDAAVLVGFSRWAGPRRG